MMITVTAAIIKKNNTFLAARRKPGSHLAGYWEFPGGKVEPGESEEHCLLRELYEEFGIRCEISCFLAESVYDYGNKKIKLRGYLVQHRSGSFACRAHDSLVWLAADKLMGLKWAPADIPLVKKVLSMENFPCGN